MKSKAATKRGHEGECHVCGKVGPLTFEHIPPQAVGNKHTLRIYPGAEIIDNGRIGTGNLEGLKYRQSQRGGGVYSLCRDCNSYFGVNYVQPFTDFFQATTLAFQESAFKDSNSVEGRKGVHFETDKLKPLAFVKQVISNFCSLTEPGSMADCRNYLLDRNNNRFPLRYRLHMYIIPDLTAHRISTGWSIQLVKDGGNLHYLSCTALSMPPFGFVLCDLKKSDMSADAVGNITNLAYCQWDGQPKIAFNLPCIEGEAVNRPLLWI